MPFTMIAGLGHMAIIIRKAGKGDAKGVARLWDDGFERGYFGYTGTNRRRTVKDIRRFEEVYAKNKRNEFVFIAIDSVNGKVVGSCAFFAKKEGRTRHRGEMGWAVHLDYSRQGIATRLVKRTLEEAKRRGFKKAEAEAAVKNIGSVRLAKKCGFKIEGRKKRGLLLDSGRYADTYVFGKVL